MTKKNSNEWYEMTEEEYIKEKNIMIDAILKTIEKHELSITSTYEALFQILKLEEQELLNSAFKKEDIEEIQNGVLKRIMEADLKHE